MRHFSNQYKLLLKLLLYQNTWVLQLLCYHVIVGKNTPQNELYNIHALVLSVMTTNKA